MVLYHPPLTPPIKGGEIVLIPSPLWGGLGRGDSLKSPFGLEDCNL